MRCFIGVDGFRDSQAEPGRNASGPNNLSLASAGTSCLGGKCLKPYNYGIMYSERVSQLSVPELESLYPLPDPCKMSLNLDVLVIRSSMVPGARTSCSGKLQGLGAEQEKKKKTNLNFLVFALNLSLCPLFRERNHAFEKSWKCTSLHSHIWSQWKSRGELRI